MVIKTKGNTKHGLITPYLAMKVTRDKQYANDICYFHSRNVETLAWG